jgi:hypothetical protein
MTTKVRGHAFTSKGLEPVRQTIKEGEQPGLFNLSGQDGKNVLVQVEDVSSDDSAHVTFWGKNDTGLMSQVVTQFTQEGDPLNPETAHLRSVHFVSDNQEMRIIGPTLEQGTSAIRISYERPASTQSLDRK